MEHDFPTVHLGEVATVIMGQSPPGSTYNEIGEGLPFFQGVADFGARYPSRRVYCTAPTRVAEEGDILFSVRAPIGRVNLAIERCATGRGLAIIRANDKENQTFIELVLRSKIAGWHALEGEGSVFGNARKKDLLELSIPWPEKGKRLLIASILGTLDDKIELNHQMNKTLEKMGQAIFKHWFVDFEFPDEEGKPYKSSGGEMVDSELGKIPKGWEAKSFSEVIAVNPKRPLKRGEFRKKVGMADLTPWQSWIGTWSQEEYKSGAKFQNGDVLFARITPSLEHGKTALVSILEEGEVAFGTTEFIVFAPDIIKSSYFILCLARDQMVRDIAIGAMTGSSGRQRVPNDCFDYIPIPVPSDHIVAKFHDTVSPMFEKISNNAEEIITLTRVRDTLLPKLISGEIRVPLPENTQEVLTEAKP